MITNRVEGGLNQGDFRYLNGRLAVFFSPYNQSRYVPDS